MSRAVEAQELRVDYQPIVDLARLSIVAVEALVRWQHSRRGLLQPHEFIPLAETSGLIIPIGQWVLEQACIFSREWPTAGGRRKAPTLHVNLSTRQFLQADIVDQVTQVLNKTGVEPPMLELEITESAMIRDLNAAAEMARALKAIGVRLAIDDFGTGYASLRYLHLFPVDSLKIDQSLIGSPSPGAGSWTIVRMLVDLAHSLNMQAVIEGVETEEQLEQVRA
ncbi:MAG TPA: EAL domain-containing protein, partial [Dehalococcoidia bacterium]|nr:EAL domain-containing protein [Dehalococcoidia bacterium]